jgi:hypothetical protein
MKPRASLPRVFGKIIVDVGGETVVTDVVAPADKFDAFLPKAQEVLDSVEWKGR